MIIQFAGTSGSGKSHLMRGFMKWADQMGVIKPLRHDDFRNPVGYDVILPKSKTIHIIGPYMDGVDTAGCDTLRNLETCYGLIHDAHDAGKHVLFEGLFMMNMTRGPTMVETYNGMTVIHFTDTLATCLSSIRERRERRGEGELLSKENTVANFKRATNFADKMRAAGATVVRVRRSEALKTLIGLLGYEVSLDKVGNFGV